MFLLSHYLLELTQRVVLFETTNILANMLQVLLLAVSRNQIVGSVTLIAGDEVGVVDGRLRNDAFHVRTEFFLKFRLEDSSTNHSLVEIGIIDVPAINDEIIRRQNGKERRKRNMHLFLSIVTKVDRRGLSNRSNLLVKRLIFNELPKVVGSLNSVLGAPAHVLLVSDNGSDRG